LPPDVRQLLLDGYDGPWVRGRMERVFGVPSPKADELSEKSGLLGKFLAVVSEEGGSLVGVPFWCGDHYLRAGLTFSGAETPGVCDRIAGAFWGLLLAAPHDLPDYTDQMFHHGSGTWLAFGVRGGRPFIDEHEDEPATA
jgi:hypothetical protein